MKPRLWLSRRKPFVEPSAPPSNRFGSEWLPVVDWHTGRCHAKLDGNALIEYGREDWPETHKFRLRDVHPAFNVMGLYWRRR